MAATSKKRTISQLAITGDNLTRELNLWGSGQWSPWVPIPQLRKSLPIGTQFTESTGHPFSRRQGANSGDVGGNFYTTKTFIDPSSIGSVSGEGGGANYPVFRQVRHNGNFLSIDPSLVSYPDQHSFPDANELGTTAISRVNPGKSAASLSTALAEIMKDKLPHLPGVQSWSQRSGSANKAGSEFLNYQFGWLPLINDVKDVANGVLEFDALLRQYIRDSGRKVRRRYSFPTQIDKSTFDLGMRYPYDMGNNSDLYAGRQQGRVTLTVETVRSTWFSGAFTYHIPSDFLTGDLGRAALGAQKVLGLELTPEVLWNLTPWSWAVDWFSNAGDVVSNVSHIATGGTVMQYGYIMCHTVTKHIYTMESPGNFLGQTPPPFTLVRETKVRQRANPFGFGVSWDGLSPVQAAIAAAIGVTR